MNIMRDGTCIISFIAAFDYRRKCKNQRNNHDDSFHYACSPADLFKRTIELLSFFESCIEEANKGGYVDKQMVADVIEKADDVITETTNEDIIHLMLITLDRLNDADLI